MELTNNTEIAPAVIAMVDVDIIRRWNILPYDFDAASGTLSLFTSQTKNMLRGATLHKILASAHPEIQMVNLKPASQEAINMAINKYYKTTPSKRNVSAAADIDNTKITQLVKDILTKARKLKVSDIHITPTLAGAAVQYRVDDNLILAENQISLEDRPNVINYIKVEAGMELSVDNRSQDGIIDKGDIEYRVGTFPNGRNMGESIVIRLQDKNVKYVRLDDMGFPEDDLKNIKTAINIPAGITLLCGPTGQGKSTTMNGIIREFNPAEYSIYSIEDPVEQAIEGVSQANVIRNADRSRIIYGMEDAVIAMMRLDPDIGYVGEVRDAGTAHAVAQLAQTGHRVFTTLHAKDCAESIVRLKGLGVNVPDFVRSVNCIAAQRLIGLNCPYCKHEVESLYNDKLTLEEKSLLKEGKYSYESTGCDKCHNTGVLGRKPIFEMMILSNETRDFFAHEQGLTETIEYLKERNFKTMWDKGMVLVANGDISLKNLWDVVRPIYMEGRNA